MTFIALMTGFVFELRAMLGKSCAAPLNHRSDPLPGCMAGWLRRGETDRIRVVEVTGSDQTLPSVGTGLGVRHT